MFLLDLFEYFRIHASGRPLIIALALAVVAGGLSRASRATDSETRWRRFGPLMATAAGLAIPAYLLVVLWYAGNEHYLDPAEPSVTIIGWLFALGQPLYHDPLSAERYSHMWGPLAFIPHGAVQRLFGPSILASKWLGAAAGLIGLAATALAVSRTTSRDRGVVVVGGCTLYLLAFRNTSFWTRPDALLFACVGLALLAALRLPPGSAAIVVGVLVGVLTNLKFTGALYALPLLALLASRGSPARALVVLPVAAVTAAAPFVLPNVSLAAYVEWVRLSAGNGLMLSMLRQNIEWSAFLLLPIGCVWFALPSPTRPRDPSWRAFVATLVLAVCAVAVAASKPGAGPYHLLPFVPLAGYATASLVGNRPLAGGDRLSAPLAMGWMTSAALIALVWQVSFVRVMHEANTRDEAGDLRRYLDAHPGEVAQMAHSGWDRPTFARPVLTYRSGLYLLDAPAVQEHQLSRMAVPPATLDAMRDCRADAWLVPRGTEPFEGRNRYPAAQSAAFPTAFRAVFHQAYEADGHTEYFDVWRCRSKVPR